MNHPDTELRLIDEQIGRGVFATRFIPKGTVVWTLCKLDICITPEQFALLPSAYHEPIITYSYTDKNGNFMLCWDLGKYTNHSCDPSFLDFGLDSCVAVKDIFPGEELTCDYGSLNRIHKFQCCCKSANCRGEIQNTDALTHYKQWEAILKDTLPYIGKVEQPLYPFIQDKAHFDAVISGKEELPSSKENYCTPDKMSKIEFLLNKES